MGNISIHRLQDYAVAKIALKTRLHVNLMRRIKPAYRICRQPILVTTKILSRRSRVDYSKTRTSGSSTALTSNNGAMSNRAHCFGSKVILGRVKTMLSCGIIDQLTKPAPDTAAVSFFFCQASYERLNHTTAVEIPLNWRHTVATIHYSIWELIQELRLG